MINKRFNTTGVCVSRKHFMVDIAKKLGQIRELIDGEFYFTISRPRQYGKTTTLGLLRRMLREEFLVVSVSFEGIGDLVFEDEGVFVRAFSEMMCESLCLIDEAESQRMSELSSGLETMRDLSRMISLFVKGASRSVILFVDEVDKSSNNQLFLSFLGMLRSKYLLREMEEDFTFRSVVLVGLYDIKSLKLKLRVDEEAKFNSPWNIAVDFDVDMSFSPDEIGSMLREYGGAYDLRMDTAELSERIYFFTSGYPFLVSRVCQIVDEVILGRAKRAWERCDVELAVKRLCEEANTLFESLIKNLEEQDRLYELVSRLLVEGELVVFNALDPTISLGMTYGLFKKGIDGLEMSNKVFEEVIYNYMISKLATSTSNMTLYNIKSNFVLSDGGLDMTKVLRRFRAFMQEQYSSKDEAFLEHHGILLFLAFIKPIINGTGFDFKEVQISEEKRLDVVITYNQFKYILEMKIWRGEKYHERGLKQLCEYLSIHGMTSGYLVVFDFSVGKQSREEWTLVGDKKIFVVYV